ncbi:hypothetical protein, partial [Moorena sp. SIO3I6]
FLYLVFFSIVNLSLDPSILAEDIVWTLYVSTALSAAVYQSRIVKNPHLLGVREQGVGSREHRSQNRKEVRGKKSCVPDCYEKPCKLFQ